MSELDRRGTAACLDEAFAIATTGTGGSPVVRSRRGRPPGCPRVGTPVPGGLNLRESHLVCEMAAASRCLLGMEMVELNPTLDVRNKTGELAVWLIQIALGKTIL